MGFRVAARTASCRLQFGELDHVAHGAIHGQNTAGEFAIGCAPAILDLDLDGPESVSAVGHARCRDGIGDQHGAFDAFRLQEKLHDFRGDVNSVRNDVGAEFLIGQHFAKDTGLAMIERTHGIEGVRGVASAGLHRRRERSP